jgi:hypothetical protein
MVFCNKAIKCEGSSGRLRGEIGLMYIIPYFGGGLLIYC